MNLRRLHIRGIAILTSMILVMFIVGFTNNAYAITVGPVPVQVEINSITDKAYVTHSDGTVKVIDVDPTSGTYNTVIDTILVDSGKTLTNLTINEVTNTIYVTNSGSNTVEIIDGATDTVTSTISLAPFGAFTVDVEINTVSNLLYVTNILSAVVMVIDIDPASPTVKIPVEIVAITWFSVGDPTRPSITETDPSPWLVT